MRHITLVIFAVCLAAETAHANECFNLSPSGPWPEQEVNTATTDWPVSTEPLLGLKFGMTPVEFCNHLDGFDGSMGYEHANINSEFSGMFAPFDLGFSGLSAWLGSGDIVETNVLAFFSGPPSGSQMNSFTVTYKFDEARNRPLMSDVVDEAIRQFGPYSGSGTTAFGFPVYAWIINNGVVEDGSSDEDCSIAQLRQADLEQMKAVKNSCAGLIELVTNPSDDDPDRLIGFNFVVEDRALLVQSRSIDAAAVASE